MSTARRRQDILLRGLAPNGVCDPHRAARQLALRDIEFDQRVLVEYYPPTREQTGLHGRGDTLPIFCYHFFDKNDLNIAYYIPSVDAMLIMTEGRIYHDRDAFHHVTLTPEEYSDVNAWWPTPVEEATGPLPSGREEEAEL